MRGWYARCRQPDMYPDMAHLNTAKGGELAEDMVLALEHGQGPVLEDVPGPIAVLGHDHLCGDAGRGEALLHVICGSLQQQQVVQ